MSEAKRKSKRYASTARHSSSSSSTPADKTNESISQFWHTTVNGLLARTFKSVDEALVVITTEMAERMGVAESERVEVAKFLQDAVMLDEELLAELASILRIDKS